MTRIPAGAHLVTVTGELDVRSAAALAEQLDRLPQGCDAVVDMDAVTVIDPLALPFLLGASRRVRASGGCLLVVCDEEQIVRALQHIRIDASLQIEPSIDDAVRYAIGRALLKRLQREARVRP